MGNNFQAKSEGISEGRFLQRKEVYWSRNFQKGQAGGIFLNQSYTNENKY